MSDFNHESDPGRQFKIAFEILEISAHAGTLLYIYYTF